MVTGLPRMGENQHTVESSITWSSAAAAEPTSSTPLKYCHQIACYSLGEFFTPLMGIQKGKKSQNLQIR